MKTVVIAISFLTFLVMEAVASIRGLDLRKWSSWLYGMVSFLAGVLLGFGLTSNLIESLKVGGIFAFMTLLGGMMTRRHKQKYEGMAKSLLLKYGKADDSSLFAQLVRRLLSKYK